MYIDPDSGGAGDIIFLQSNFIAFGQAFLCNDRFVMTAADKLHFSCGSAAAVGACDIWCSYIDQQFAQEISMTGRIGVGSSKSGLIDRFYAGDRPDKYGGHYGFMAYNAGTSWTSVGQHVTVSFPDERYDNGSNYSASNSRYYPAEEGLYWFSDTIYTGGSDTSSSFGFMVAGEVDS